MTGWPPLTRLFGAAPGLARQRSAGCHRRLLECLIEMSEHSPAYHLVRPPPPAGGAPVLDAAQRAVVDHEGLPLLVLAGPGTRKTTAIVATVADRITRRCIYPDRELVLTVS